MSFFDLVAIIVCAIVGYYLVAVLFRQRRQVKLSSVRPNVKEQSLIHTEAHGSSAVQDLSHDMSNRWYKVLGVSSIATVSEIQRAYRTLVAQRQNDVASCRVQGSDKNADEIDEAYRYIVSKYGDQHFRALR